MTSGEKRPYLPAESWNSMVSEVERTIRKGAHTGNAPRLTKSIVIGYNNTGSDILPFQAVILGPKRTNWATNPNPNTTQTDPEVVHITIPEDTCYGRFGITLDTIVDGDSGEIAFDGIAVAECFYENHESSDRCDTVSGETYLQMSPAGGAQILHWTQEDFGTWGYAIIRLNADRGLEALTTTNQEVFSVVTLPDYDIVLAENGVIWLDES